MFANTFNIGHTDSIGGSEIVLVDVDGNEVVAKTGVFDTGIYQLDYPSEAVAIIIRRTTGSG